MKTHLIQVEYPEHFPDALQTTADGFEQEARIMRNLGTRYLIAPKDIS